jgi:hypothetical protein
VTQSQKLGILAHRLIGMLMRQRIAMTLPRTGDDGGSMVAGLI